MTYPGIGTPSSAGYCQVCHDWADKRYGGEGRYLVVCWDCWEQDADFQNRAESAPNREAGKVEPGVPTPAPSSSSPLVDWEENCARVQRHLQFVVAERDRLADELREVHAELMRVWKAPCAECGHIDWREPECDCAYEVTPGGIYPERRFFHSPDCSRGGR